jgi:hypothetical protein
LCFVDWDFNLPHSGYFFLPQISQIAAEYCEIFKHQFSKYKQIPNSNFQNHKQDELIWNLSYWVLVII